VKCIVLLVPLQCDNNSAHNGEVIGMTEGVGHAYIVLGTVENHGKKWQKTRHTFVKIIKITAKSRQFI